MGLCWRRLFWPTVRGVVFGVLLYLYVWLRIEPGLLYHARAHFPVFLTGSTFLAPFLTCPGGPVEYLAACLSQFFYHSWLGALIVTAIAGLFCLAAHSLIVAMGGSRLRALCLAPVLAVLILYSRYVHAPAILIALLLAVLCAGAYARLARRSVVFAATVFVVLSVPLYYAAGGAYLVYATICGLFEFYAMRRRMLGLCCLLAAEVVPYMIGARILGVGSVDVYARLLPIDPRSTADAQAILICLYIFFPLVALGIALGVRRAATPQQSEAAPKAKSSEESEAPERFPRPDLRCVLQSLALLIAIAVPTGLLSDGAQKRLLQIDYYARHKMWPEVLQEASRLSPREYTFVVTHDVIMALYYTGGLPGDMFSYVQTGGSLQFYAGLHDPTAYANRKGFHLQLGDLDFQLGLVNDAEHWAHEALETLGDHPSVLRELALVNIVKGQTEAARVFLRVLSKDLYHGGEARSLLSRMESDPLLSADPGVQRVRSVMLVGEPVCLRTSFEERCIRLLEVNRRNRMAFEYLMAHYLLTRQLDKLADNIGRLDDFGYPGIPRHYEEAIVVYEGKTGKTTDLHGRSLSPGKAEDHDRFCGMFELFHATGDITGARDSLREEYGTTYYFYYVFGESGVTQ